MSDLQAQAPTRLLDSPELGSALANDLRLASAHAPMAYDVDAGLARFEQALSASATAPSSAGSAMRVLGWVVGAAVLISGGVGAAMMMGEHDKERVTQDEHALVAERDHTQAVRAEDTAVAGSRSSDAREPQSGSRTSESVVEAGVHQSGDPGDVGAAPAQAEGGSPALDTSDPPRPTSKPAPSPELTLADEAKQINAARKALPSDPAQALALTQAAEQQFPNGAMIQERRGYAILALVALDRVAEAGQRADAYLERWPMGPLSRRVRDALGR